MIKNPQTITLFYQQWAHPWCTESRSVLRSGFPPPELALTVRRCYAFLLLLHLLLLLRLFFLSHHNWAFHSHLTTRAKRRGQLKGPTCSIKWSIFLIHNRPGTTRPTGPADWCGGCQTLTSNPKENTRTRTTSGCHSAATGEWIRFGIKVTAAIVLQQLLIMAKL